MFWRILSTKWPLNSLKAASRPNRLTELETFRLMRRLTRAPSRVST